MPAQFEAVAQNICATNALDYIDFIDSGAYKETYKVKSNDNYALKVFKPNNSSERTKREIDAMTRARCCNISKLIRVDSYEYDGHEYLYLLEEYLGGGSLSAALKAALFSRSEVILLARDLISALKVTHENNIVHRDIKPDNILFREGTRDAVLVDFGLVRDLAAVSLTQAFQLRGPGTPLYSSPEQLNNQKPMIDWRSDQFSLGISLCIAAFGIHPFEGGSLVSTVEKIATFSHCNSGTITKLREAGLDPIIKMLEPYPINRYRIPSMLLLDWLRLEV